MPLRTVAQDVPTETFATTTTGNTITTTFGTNSTVQMNENYDETELTETVLDQNSHKSITNEDYISAKEQVKEKPLKAELRTLEQMQFNKQYCERNKNTEVGTQECTSTRNEENDLHVTYERNDALTQKSLDDFNEGVVTGKKLLETLRRELQYEELIDLEIRKRQRVFHENESSRDDILERVDEEEDNIELEEIGIAKNNEQDLVENSEPQILNKYASATSESNELKKVKNLELKHDKVFYYLYDKLLILTIY